MDYHNHIEIDSASNLIGFLRDIQEGVATSINIDMLYRGVGSDEYGLLPAAFRKDGEKTLDDISRLSGDKFDEDDMLRNASHGLREFSAVRSFYSLANQQGLSLPTDSAVLHSELISKVVGLDNLDSVLRFYGQRDKWPQAELLPTIALAQHYGIPTRILDWTLDPLVAAFFAARNAFTRIEREGSHEGKFSIWYANKVSLAASTLFNKYKDIATPRYSVHVVDVPYNGNPNLTAQKGRFTIVSPRENQEPNDPVDKTTVDEAMVKIFEDTVGIREQAVVFPKSDVSLFTKVSIPLSEAKPLLIKLRVAGYHSGAIFPGYQGCADSLLDAVALGTSTE